MLSYQQSYFNPCVELTRELWERVTRDPSLQENVHKCTEIYEQLGKGAAYDAQKKKLPLVMFCCTFDPNNGAKGKQPLGTWRCQSAVNINGLFMYDADELPIEKLVDYTYELCERAAEDAGKNDDLVLDLLRCRAVFYAQWFTVPIIVTRAIEERRALAESNKPGADLPSVLDLCRVTDDDLKFSEVMFNSVVAWQDAYFGQMLQDSWENADKAFVPRVKRSKNADAYILLPQEFKNADVQKHLNLDSNAAHAQIDRWVKAGYVEHSKENARVFHKVVDFII